MRRVAAATLALCFAGSLAVHVAGVLAPWPQPLSNGTARIGKRDAAQLEVGLEPAGAPDAPA